MPFDALPSNASLRPHLFTARASDTALVDLRTLLQISKIGPQTYENQIANAKDYCGWGISRDWLRQAKQTWLHGYDWRKTEDRINSFNNYQVDFEDGGFAFRIHFVAAFSRRTDAAPILLMHGWPGSFLEFLPMLDIARKRYEDETLPFHLIIPSLPGYGYSNGPPLDKDFKIEDIARIMDKLMIGLGFEAGYITQGGDIGSFASRVLAAKYPSCKACHLNLAVGLVPESEAEAQSMDQKALGRMRDFGVMGDAYARHQGTRASTIGLVLSSSPVALLAWIGEKFVQWTDKSPPVEDILDSVTLYWLTDSFPRSIYPYREFFGPTPTVFHNDPALYIKKPLGYSLFPEDLSPVPSKLVAKSGNLVWISEHDQGGHFAAMEQPLLFLQDMEGFIKKVWPGVEKPQSK